MPQRPRLRRVIDEIPVYSKAKGLDRVVWTASSNESPVPPAPGVVAAVTRAAEVGNRYPSMFGEELTAALAERYNLSTEQIAVGAGSLSLLQQALTAYTDPDSEVVYAWRSYEAYPITVRVAGAQPVEVPLTEALTHDVDAMAAAVTARTRAMILCNPNNPTGTATAFTEISRLLHMVPQHVLIILDEAYREFLPDQPDGLDLIDTFPNLLVTRTFSKAYGLAGVRAGFAMAHPELMAGLRKVQPPFGLSRLAQDAALSALADTAHMDRIIDTITADRDGFVAQLQKRGLHVLLSSGNFVWIPTPGLAERLVDTCLDRGVAVRAFPAEGVRITMGEPDATAAVLSAVDSILPDLLAEQEHDPKGSPCADL